MTLTLLFANYMQEKGIANLGQNLIIGRAPTHNENLESAKVPDNLWWIIQAGGNPIRKNSTGESMKMYQLQVYYRARSYKQVEENLSLLEELVSCDACTPLAGVDVIDMEVSTYPIDNDLDSEDRKVGLLTINITVYKGCI